MISSTRVIEIMEFYEIYNHEDYEVMKVDPDNIQIIHTETGKILSLRY